MPDNINSRQVCKRENTICKIKLFLAPSHYVVIQQSFKELTQEDTIKEWSKREEGTARHLLFREVVNVTF